MCWGRQQETAWLRIQQGCPVAPVPPAQREALPFPWVSLFLLSKKLLSALVDRDELLSIPAASAVFLFGDFLGLPGSAGAAVGAQPGHGATAMPDPKTGRKRMGQARGIPGQGQQASSLRMHLIN